MNTAKAMRKVRELLAAAHEAERAHDIEAADALGARAANVLAGVCYREARRPELYPAMSK